MRQEGTVPELPMKFLRWGALCALLVCSVVPVRADIYDTNGFGDRGTSMSGAVCASVRSLDALYYNVAGLGKVDASAMQFAYLGSYPRFDVDGGVSGVPENHDLETGMYVTSMGVNLNTMARLPVTATFGFSVSIMDDLKVAVVEDLDESRHQFVRYGAPVKRTAVYTGLGVEVVPNWVWIGVGGHGLVTGNAAVNLTIYPSDMSTTDAIKPSKQEFWLDSKLEFSPSCGIIVNPWRTLNLGASYKKSIEVKFDPFDAVITMPIGTNNAAKVAAYTALLSFYNPDVYRAGLSFELFGLTVEADAGFELWSHFHLSKPREEKRVVPKFKDIVTYHGGLEYAVSIVRVRAGYAYVPSPVPDQPGASNFIDCDRHIVSAGLGLEFTDPLGIFYHPISLGISVQDHIMARRNFSKDDGVDYSVTGHAYAAYASLTLRFSGSHTQRSKDDRARESLQEERRKLETLLEENKKLLKELMEATEKRKKAEEGASNSKPNGAPETGNDKR